jgi:hypothetical protein
MVRARQVNLATVAATCVVLLAGCTISPLTVRRQVSTNVGGSTSKITIQGRRDFASFTASERTAYRAAYGDCHRATRLGAVFPTGKLDRYFRGSGSKPITGRRAAGALGCLNGLAHQPLPGSGLKP